MKTKLRLILFICLTCIMLGSFIGCSSTTGATNNSKLTMANYEKIKNEMTMQEVEAILGKGEESVSSENKDLKLTIKSYQWVDKKSGANIQIMFQNDKVNTKAQAGLK